MLRWAIIGAAACVILAIAAVCILVMRPQTQVPMVGLSQPDGKTQAYTVTPADLGPAQTYSLEKYRQFLRDFVDERGLVDYGRLKRQRSHIKDLLKDLNQLSPNRYRNWPPNDQIAFWINAYNIQALKIITDNYPIQGSRWLIPIYGQDSIRHIKGLKTEYKFLVMDEEFTLAEVEERIFRQQFQEPRVFLALTTLSLSGPALNKEPYYGPRLDDQLNDQAKRFLSDPKGLQIDREGRRLRLSALFQSTWHGEDFVRNYAIDRKFKAQPPYLRAVLNFVCPFMGPVDREFLEVENYSVEFTRFDWTLNDGSKQ